MLKFQNHRHLWDCVQFLAAKWKNSEISTFYLNFNFFFFSSVSLNKPVLLQNKSSLLSRVRIIQIPLERTFLDKWNILKNIMKIILVGKNWGEGIEKDGEHWFTCVSSEDKHDIICLLSSIMNFWVALLTWGQGNKQVFFPFKFWINFLKASRIELSRSCSWQGCTHLYQHRIWPTAGIIN